MHSKYVTLFKELARATAVSAEQVMDYDHEKGDDKGFETAKIMRDDFEDLHDKIAKAGDNYIPTKAEVARLLVGAMVQTNQLQDRIAALKKAMTGYQTDIIPKLQEILDNAENDETAAKLADEKFIIQEE